MISHWKFRNSLSSLPSQQLNKVLKICDQIDTLGDLEIYHMPIYNPYVMNGDGDLQRQLRNKLKFIEDMASSAKLTKASGFEAGKEIKQSIVSIVSSLGSSYFTHSSHVLMSRLSLQIDWIFFKFNTGI